MTDLGDFLLARIAEDEEVARAAAENVGGYLIGDPPTGDWVSYSIDYEGIQVSDKGPGIYPPADPTTAHIARWDPARVISECSAKRRIVEELVEAIDYDEEIHEGVTTTAAAGERALNWLALPYADHPEFRKEWRP